MPDETRDRSTRDLGQLIAGRYRLEGSLARGAMAQTYLARDLTEGDRVVVKVAARGHADLLRREAQALARVDHPRVVSLREAGSHRRAAFLVMDYVRGGTLERLRLARGGALPPRLVARLVAEIAEALDAIHAAGLVHADVKGANVIVQPGLGATLIDLGLSAYVRAGATDHVMGTPTHVAPERAAGDFVPAEALTRQDVYSLAVLAFELLAGELPIDGEDITELIRAHAREAPRDLSDALPSAGPGVDGVFRAALRKDPAGRTPNPRAFASQLTEALTPLLREAHFLVADDDPDWRRLLSTSLARRLPGARVHAASDGREALTISERRWLTGAIVDLDMPHMDGLALARALRERYGPGFPIVAVTGSLRTPKGRELARVAHEVMAKPATPRDVIATLSSLLELPDQPAPLRMSA